MASHGNFDGADYHADQQQQPNSTPWGPVAAVLLCLLPFALLLLVTLSRRLLLPSSTSLPLAAAIMAVVRLAYLSSPPLFVMGSAVRGVLESATPLSVIYGAILLFETMQHTKCLSWLMSQVKSLSAGEPLGEVFLIGWAFSYMISGVGGFNTPIALSAPMLSSLGHDPMLSLLVVVMLNTLASHMGSVGMAIWFGFKTLDLGQANILFICLKSSIIVGVMSYIIAPISASFLVPWRQLLRCSLFVFLSISSAVIPTALVAIFNAEFPVLIGGLCSMFITTVLIHYKVGLGPQHNPHLLEITAGGSAVAEEPTTAVTASCKATCSQADQKQASTVWQQLQKQFRMFETHATCSASDIARVTETCRTDANSSGTDVVLTINPVPQGPNTVSYRRNCELFCSAAMGHRGSEDHASNSLSVTAAAECIIDRGDADSVDQFGVTAARAATNRVGVPKATVDSTADLRSLTSVSCPHEGWRTLYPWDVTDNAEAGVGRQPSRGFGCEGLWEDNNSAMMTTLPASLAAATIHHATLSGVSRVPWFAGVGAGLMHAASRVRGRQQRLQQLADPCCTDLYLQQHQLKQGSAADVCTDQSSPDVCEIYPATTTFEPQPVLQGQDFEDGLSGTRQGSTCTGAEAEGTTSQSADLYCTVDTVDGMQQHSQRQHHWRQTLSSSTEFKHKLTDGEYSLRRSLPSINDLFWRTLPIWATVLLLLLTRMPQLKIRGLLTSTHPSVEVHLGTLGTLSLSPSLVVQLKQVFTLQGVNWRYEVLYVPCLLPFVVASLVTLMVHRSNMREQQLSWSVPFVHAAQKMRGTVTAIIGAMILSELISSGGVSSSAFIIGYQLSTWLGRGYLAVAGFLGALGSFVSGSVMAGNMTSGAIQKVAAERVGVSVTSMLAVHTAGSCAGKMMCISNILSAKVMLNLEHLKEGKIVRRTAPLAVMFVVLSQAFGLWFTLAGVWPDAAPS